MDVVLTLVFFYMCSAPLSKRNYILDYGLRSTVGWIMADLADIQVSFCGLHMFVYVYVHFVHVSEKGVHTNMHIFKKS